MNIVSPARPPVQQHMSDRSDNHDQAGNNSSAFNNAVGCISYSSVIVGGIGTCVVTPIMSCTAADPASGIVAVASLGVCVAGLLLMGCVREPDCLAFGDEETDPNNQSA